MSNIPPDIPITPPPSYAQSTAKDPTYIDTLPTIARPWHLDIPKETPPTLKWTDPSITALEYLSYIDAPPIHEGTDAFVAALTYAKLTNCPIYPPIMPDLPPDSNFYMCQLHTFLTQRVEPRISTVVWRRNFLSVRFPDRSGKFWHGADEDRIREWLRTDLRYLPAYVRKQVMCGMAFNDGGVREEVLDWENDETSKKGWSVFWEKGGLAEHVRKEFEKPDSRAPKAPTGKKDGMLRNQQFLEGDLPDRTRRCLEWVMDSGQWLG